MTPRKGKAGSGASKASGRGKSPPKPSPKVRSAALVDRTDPNRHLVERQKMLYGIRHNKCLVDYASREAAKTWPRYVVLPNGEQGPAPFRDVAEMKEFERRYRVRSE